MPVVGTGRASASSVSMGNTLTREFLLLMQDSTSNRRKRFFKLLVVLAVPMAVLVLQCSVVIIKALHSKSEATRTTETITTTIQTATIVTRLQRERGMTSLFLSSHSPEAWKNVVNFRKSSDAGIAAVEHWPGNVNDGPALATRDAFRDTLVEHRIPQTSNHTSIEEVFWYTKLITGALKLMNRDIRLSGDVGGQLWTYLFAYESFVNAKECWGIQRALGSAYYGRGYHVPDEKKLFYEVYLKAQTFLSLCFDHSQRSRALYDSLVADKTYLLDYINAVRKTVLEVPNVTADAQTGLNWFGNMTTYIDLTSGIETDLTNTIQDQLAAQVATAQGELSEALTFLIIVSIVCPPLCVWYFLSVSRINRTIGKSAKALANQTTELSAEKRKGEKLLHRMLPPTIADALKRGENVSAEHFDSTTKISSRSTPLQVVELLNGLYTKFDSELDSHDVYKVETIGDAYMVVSGLPQRNGNAHGNEIATLSLELLKIVYDFKIPHLPTDRLKLRIGLHTGPVLAGVVGKKMPRYCLFGPTVADAATMEQSGLPLRVHISQTCKNLLDKLGGFECVKRARESADNLETTYWLLAKDGYKFRADAPELL
ncbi:uncharacterized protein LOC129599347 [Paramacrobiotus metropolitanus]|uniref:uncharacterized protein LOC129599347 n=1 Tax=Paramacrobiotus metropolitanus TaxID=2943436 RepID=UPI002446471A|nr:uncharacterized protein LOC129599347 [Paramacrobiotus metropolitanus]